LKPALLDVNVLIALFDESHVHHQTAHDWFAENRRRGWATCPITENGFLRVMSRPIEGRTTVRPGTLAGYLRGLCSAPDHVFWPASISLRDSGIFELSAATQRQLTDIYLAGLAHTNGGVFATFDRMVPSNIIVGAAPDLLEVIGG